MSDAPSTPLRPPPELTGRIEGATLAGLLQMLEQTRKTGELTLQGQTGPRLLAWREGELVVPEEGSLVDLLVCVMAERKLSFEFTPVEVPPASTLPLTGSLLDALRILDEWVLALWGLPPLDTVFEIAPSPSPDAALRPVVEAFDGARTMIEVALSLGRPASEVGDVLRRATAAGVLRAFDPTTSSGSVLAPPAEAVEPAPPPPPRSSLGGATLDPTRVSAHFEEEPRGSSAGTVAVPSAKAGGIVAWFRRLFGRDASAAAVGTTGSTSGGASAKKPPAPLPPAPASGRGTPWERHDAALGEDAAEVAARLPKALAAEHKQVRDVGDREFVERLVASCTRALDLPMFPDAARRLDGLVRKGDPDLRDVVDVVRSDPDLARRVMQVASTAAQGRTPRDLDRAVARIGLDHVLRVSVSVFLQAPIFKVPGHETEARLARRAAVLAGEIASSRVGASHDAANQYLAALLHEVGRLQILRLAVVRPGRAAPSPAIVASMCARYQTSVATLMVARWGLGRDIEAAVARHPSPRPGKDDVARRVRIAQIGAHAALATSIDEAAFEKVLKEIDGGDAKALLTQARACARSALALGI